MHPFEVNSNISISDCKSNSQKILASPVRYSPVGIKTTAISHQLSYYTSIHIDPALLLYDISD